MEDFDPVLEASRNIDRRKGYKQLFVGSIIVVVGILIMVFYGKIDFNYHPNHHSVGRWGKIEDVFGMGFYGLCILFFGVILTIRSLTMIFKNFSKAIIPDLQSKQSIENAEKELTNSKDELTEMANDKIRKRGDFVNSNDEDEESTHDKIRKMFRDRRV